MYRTLPVLKDTYITNRIIRNNRVTGSNVGVAGSLDLFKIYGNSFSGSSPLTELSRLLIQFDLSDLSEDVSAGKIDISSNTFKCFLNLYDVYGGQPTPANFTVNVYPLSQSFSEGLGRDIVFYQDRDVCNWITASYDGSATPWFGNGAAQSGSLGSSNIDIISTANLGAGTVSLVVTQSFPKGTENLAVDVTKIVSATLAGQMPDCGFRISFTDSLETNDKTYFVKRFGSSQAVDPYVHPRLVVKYNDAIVSNENSVTFNSTSNLFLYNYVRGNLSNVTSGSSLIPITGSDCMMLRMITPVSTSQGFVNYETAVTASQLRVGTNWITGVYSASFTLLSSNSQLNNKLLQSGSIQFDQIWGSLDGTVGYYSGSFTAKPPSTSTGPISPRRYYVNVTNVATEYLTSDVARMKVFVFDYSDPMVKVVKVPVETPSVPIENAYYSIRDVANNAVIVPFDTTYGSTKLSCDSQTMYFDLWMNNLVSGRAYTVDLMIIEGGQQQIYRDASPAFRVSEM